MAGVVGYRERVGDDQLVDRGVLQPIHRRWRQHAVRGDHPDREGASLLEQFGGTDHGACGIDHVVDDDAVPVLDVAHHPEGRTVVADVLSTAFVDEGDAGIEMGGKSRGELHPTRVRGYDRRWSLKGVLDVVGEQSYGSEVVERCIDEALDLPGMQVEGDDPIGAGLQEEISHQPGRDRLTGPAFLVLAGVAVEGDNGGDPFRRRPHQGVDHDQLLHDVEVDRVGVALDHEGVGTANALGVMNVDLTVGEDRALHAAKLDAEDAGHLLGEGLVARTREHHQPFPARKLHQPPSISCRRPELLGAFGAQRSLAPQLAANAQWRVRPEEHPR